MKTCPRCGLENPSKANFCLKCGASLGEGTLSEEILLKKELNEANATIEVLKKSLSAAQKELEASQNVEFVQELKTQIDEKNQEIDDLNKKIAELAGVQNKKLKKGKWGWVFVLLFLVASVVSAVLLSNLEKSKKELRDSGMKIENQKNHISQLEDQQSSLKDQVRSLQSQMNDDGRKMQEIISTYPLYITDIEIANTYKDGSYETEYGNTLYSDRTMYLKPKLKYKGFASKNVTLNTKWYNPDGTQRNGTSSPVGFSQSFSRSISIGDNELELGGWGNSSRGHWGKGTYRLEIWYGDVCLKSRMFTIY